jgi:hypothetical protein
MVRAGRLITIEIALVAMMLRAVLPNGWMPGPVGTPLIICTGYSIQHVVLDANGNPSAPQQGDHSNVCPYAACAHLSLPTLGPNVLPPRHIHIAALACKPRPQIAPSRLLRYAISPRAPPVFA